MGGPPQVPIVAVRAEDARAGPALAVAYAPLPLRTRLSSGPWLGALPFVSVSGLVIP